MNDTMIRSQIAETATANRGARVRRGKAACLRKALALHRLANDYRAKGQDALAAELDQSARDLLVKASKITIPEWEWAL